MRLPPSRTRSSLRASAPSGAPSTASCPPASTSRPSSPAPDLPRPAHPPPRAPRLAAPLASPSQQLLTFSRRRRRVGRKSQELLAGGSEERGLGADGGVELGDRLAVVGGVVEVAVGNGPGQERAHSV